MRSLLAMLRFLLATFIGQLCSKQLAEGINLLMAVSSGKGTPDVLLKYSNSYKSQISSSKYILPVSLTSLFTLQTKTLCIQRKIDDFCAIKADLPNS